MYIRWMAAPVDPTNESKTYNMVGFFLGAYIYIYIYIDIDIDRGRVETWGFQFDDKHVGSKGDCSWRFGEIPHVVR